MKRQNDLSVEFFDPGNKCAPFTRGSPGVEYRGESEGYVAGRKVLPTQHQAVVKERHRHGFDESKQSLGVSCVVARVLGSAVVVGNSTRASGMLCWGGGALVNSRTRRRVDGFREGNTSGERWLIRTRRCFVWRSQRVRSTECQYSGGWQW